MAWVTINDQINIMIEAGEIPANHKLLGYSITNADGQFALGIPNTPSESIQWSAQITDAVLLPSFEHASLVAKTLRGKFRPTVVTGCEDGGNRCNFYLPGNSEDTFKRPKNWNTLHQLKVNEYIKDGELPTGTKMKGYVLRIVASDEFLVRHTNDSIAEGWVWALHPNQAKIFKDFSKACKIARRHKEADVFPLLDAGTHYFIFEPTNN